eukprot:CAMPEP_0202822544 /NCGR_PEP_ID=MMETSP1389-20130828/11138_1 /ASSEMBLY_ACC=CAM_ASM_000865 /TAXON_ID=302021 /ORGANISM="Rhodomonas sp., Strain CCMP768" /LENGTH=130 /DNA_ID=CAMNT_0049495465 /DNA_START=515 /DNA_END=905 /DNA_ORIENTATION=+
MAWRGLREEMGLGVHDVALSLNMTPGPVKYFRKYEDGRVDKQLTWLWLFVLSAPGPSLQIRFDEEVAAHAWVNVSGARDWVSQAPTDFCHETIVRLVTKGLDILRACMPFSGRTAAKIDACFTSQEISDS